MRAIWGDMALAMLRKRVRDVRADLTSLTEADLEKIVDLLRERTLPSIMGVEGAEAKAKQYRAWVANGSRIRGIRTHAAGKLSVLPSAWRCVFGGARCRNPIRRAWPC